MPKTNRSDRRARAMSLVLLLCAVMAVELWHCSPTPIQQEPSTEQQTTDSAAQDDGKNTPDKPLDTDAANPPEARQATDPGQPDDPTGPDIGQGQDNPTQPDTSVSPDRSTPPDPRGGPDQSQPPDTRTIPEPTPEQAPPEQTTPDQPVATQKIALTASLVAGKTGTILVSNGIPFAAGVLKSTAALRLLDNGKEIPVFAKPLAKWQDGSIRSALLQFQRSATAFPAALSLEVGASRTTTDRQEVAVTWTLPQAVAFPTAAYICKTLAFGLLVPLNADNRFATYDQNAVTYYNQHKGTKDWGNDARVDGYYSTTLTWYLLFARSGDLERYQWARREAVHYRDDQIIQTGTNAGTMNGRNEPRYLYMQAMELDYLLNGDPKTLQVAGLMAKYLRGLHPDSWYHFKKTDTRFWTERRAAFPLLGLLVYGRWTGDAASLTAAKNILDNILNTQKEWPDGGWLHNLYAHDSAECSDRSAYGGSPFMTGLMFEALAAYYMWTKDARITASIKKATDWLWTKGWKTTGFLYMIGCGTTYTDAVPDLNLLIAHGFAFAYWTGGKKAADSTRAWTVFNQGVTNAYLKTRKHYNQNYRSSHNFLWYITQ